MVPMRILPTLTLAVFSCVTYASGFQLLERLPVLCKVIFFSGSAMAAGAGPWRE